MVQITPFKYEAFFQFSPGSFKAESQSEDKKIPPEGLRVYFRQALSPLINNIFSSGQVALQSGGHSVPMLLTQGEVLTTYKLETRPR